MVVDHPGHFAVAVIASPLKYYVENHLRHCFAKQATPLVSDADENDASSVVPPVVFGDRTRLPIQVVISQQ